MAPRGRHMTRNTRTSSGTNWGRFVFAAPVVVPAASKVLVLTFTLDNPGISEVVRRTRGDYFVGSDQQTTTELQMGAWGCIVVTDAALAAGVASIPGPVTDANDDGWFVWESFVQSSSAGAAGNIAAWQGVHRPYDSKAMRKFPDGFSLAVVVENAHATFGLEFYLGISLLASRDK